MDFTKRFIGSQAIDVVLDGFTVLRAQIHMDIVAVAEVTDAHFDKVYVLRFKGEQR